MNIYIESIEGGTYVVGFGNNEATTFLKDDDDNIKSFQCLDSVKRAVSEIQYNKVWLKQNTPYDEMCGLPTDNDKLILELDWL